MSTRTLKILSLLFRQRSFTREEITKAYGIREEAVDRYVERLTEAGIPISFDQSTGRYRLTDLNGADHDPMSPFDVFVLRLAVRLLKARLKGQYKPTVQNIEAHLDSLSSRTLPVKIDSLLDSIERSSDASHLLQDLNCCLILEAIRLGREIQVVQSDQSGLTRETVVVKASLEFGDEWVLRDLGGACTEEIPISTVTDIRLV